ncbi:MAG: hypothetical protein PHX08_02010 [Lachnospiraceae bacterium]|nr:hypothetical protein [Lachnospiraceae bacterium]
MKQWSILWSVLLVIVLLSSCTNPQSINSNPPETETVTVTETETSKGLVMKSYAGKTAIVIEDTELIDPYFITVNDEMQQALEKMSNKILLSANDIVLVLEESNGFCRVILPYGDLPQVRGKVAKDMISYDTSLFKKANQVYLKNATVYDTINGNKIDHKTGAGIVEDRKDGWALVSFPGGDRSFWIKENELTYLFDAQIEHSENINSTDQNNS